AIQDHCGELAQLSDRHVRHLARPWFTAGRPPQDFLDALDHPPDGPQHAYTQPVRDPAGWARSRLAPWLRPDGTLPPTPAQAAAAADRARQAEQAARHREQETLRQQAVDALAGGLGAAARAAMRAASPATARALDRAALTKTPRRPPAAGTTGPGGRGSGPGDPGGPRPPVCPHTRPGKAPGTRRRLRERPGQRGEAGHPRNVGSADAAAMRGGRGEWRGRPRARAPAPPGRPGAPR